MQLSFSKDSFPNVKLFIATPMYGGTCTSNYVQGMVDLSAACANYTIPMNFFGVVNESLVQKARNMCANAFLESDFTHFLFIDADVGFTAKDALSLLYLASSDKEGKYDVLAGPYPKKKISWEKVKQAVQKGLVKEDARLLANYVGDYTFLAPPNTPFSLTSPAEVLEIGTGFMLIARKTFEKFTKAYPENVYKGAKGKKNYAFFNCVIDPDTQEFLPEDRLFCQMVRKMGGKIWLAPWLRLTHQGSYSFQGSLAHLAAASLAPADL